MRIALIFTLLLFAKILSAQDTIRRFEFGSKILTINTYNTNNSYYADRPALEVMNGLFFRYAKKRFGLRLHTSYSDNTVTYESPSGTADGGSGDRNNKDFRIGVGGQYSILKYREWLYTFLDLSFRSVFSTGHNYGGIWGTAEKFTSTSNGFDLFYGFGFKIQILKHVYLSPEIGLYSSTNFIDKTTTPLYRGEVSNYVYTETYLNPVIKLHLTVKF